MIPDIKYDKLVRFTGRNGYFLQSGLAITYYNDKTVMFTPITSKGKWAHCDMEIPKENLQELIDTLTKLL